jgi:hypothetical protein
VLADRLGRQRLATVAAGPMLIPVAESVPPQKCTEALSSQVEQMPNPPAAEAFLRLSFRLDLTIYRLYKART